MNEDYDLTAKALFDSLLSKSFERIEEEEDSGVYYSPPLEGVDIEELPLLEEEDRDILMHRDAHFGKNFGLMLQHYEDEGIGAVLDVEPERIAALMQLEESLGKNLAPYLLQGPDAEKVAQSIKLYKALSEQLHNKAKAPLVAAISELILSEETQETAAKKAVKVGPKLIPYLMQLLQTPILYDPLFPGYGQAPIRACLALGTLQAKEAIKLLFGLIGTEDFDTENASIQALRLIGDPAKEFCLAQLASRPITKNNERAAIALSSMDYDYRIALALLEELEDPQIQKLDSLTSYLVIGVAKIPADLKERFMKVAAKLPSGAREELTTILKSC